jgi:branched-subunit amino acid transport protein
MSAAAVLLAAGALTWLLRIAMITLLPADRLPAAARGLLDHAAPAALAAMVGIGIAGGLALPELGARLPVLVGAAVTAVIAWRRAGLVLPVVAGLTAALLVGAL